MSYKDFDVSSSVILKDVLIIKPNVFWDLRGNIYTSYNADLYPQIFPLNLDFKHDKFAQSKFNVLRGLHGDEKTWKLISCVWGELYEVVVDMRPNSKTYKKWDAFELSSDDYSQILVPPGFVNGYYVRSENAVFHYKLAYEGDYIDAIDQITYGWNDKSLGIIWPCEDPILQPRDKK